ncbi:MAG: MbnP family copper-binding protein [Myxococcota bacterium]
MKTFTFTKKWPMITLTALALSVGVAACGDDGDDDDGGDDAGQATTTDVELSFAARVGSAAAACGQEYPDIGTADTRISIKDLRMFISDVRLIGDSGEVALELEQDGVWQYENVALLDFENASDACAEAGTTETNTAIRGTVPEGTYSGITFVLGVPFELNHQDSATAPSPFNLGAMQWNWQGGYKYLRVDLLNDNPAPGNAWNIHLGATGCESAGPTEAPASECARPNRPEYSFAAFDPTTEEVVMDLAAILDGSDVSINTLDTPPGCMSFPPDVDDCAQVFPSLGLSFDTGLCVEDCANQTLFTVQDKQ